MISAQPTPPTCMMDFASFHFSVQSFVSCSTRAWFSWSFFAAFMESFMEIFYEKRKQSYMTTKQWWNRRATGSEMLPRLPFRCPGWWLWVARFQIEGLGWVWHLDPAKGRIWLFKKSGTTEGLDLMYTHFPRLVPETVFPPLLASVVHCIETWLVHCLICVGYNWLHKILMLGLGVALKKQVINQYIMYLTSFIVGMLMMLFARCAYRSVLSVSP